MHSRSEVDREAYFNAQQTISITINHAKAEFCNDKLANCDSKTMFKIVNELIVQIQSSIKNNTIKN